MDFNRRKRFAVYGGALLTTAALFAMNGGTAGAASTDATPSAVTSTSAVTATTGATVTSTSTSTSTTASTSTTVPGPTTTTTVPLKQTTVSGSATSSNSCTSSVLPAGLIANSTVSVGVGLSTSAFPQPHKGQPINLTKTVVTVTVPGSTLQAGVTPGFIHDGDKIPSVLTLVVSGSNTTEGTHTYTVHGTSTVKVVGTTAQPLVAVNSLPNTTWHPKNATDAVVFSEKSAKVVSTITIGPPVSLTVTSTMACNPSASTSFIALSAQGASSPTTTTPTTVATVITAAAATTTSTTVAAAAANTLPRTGTNGLFLLIVGAATVDAGAALVLLARRKTSRV